MNMDSRKPFTDKYRPSTLSSIIGHEHIIKSLKNMIENGEMAHLLLYGPPGTGKSSIISSLVKDMYGEMCPLMVMDLNTSDSRGIETVRTKIKNFSSITPHFDYFGIKYKFKMVILDEVDSMTEDAQSVLRHIMEQNNDTRFCLICNYVHKVNPALQSRCCTFRFKPLSTKSIKEKVEIVIKSEKIKLDDEGIDAIIFLSNGDMRRALNLLQSTFLTYGKNLDKEKIYNCSGYISPEILDNIYIHLIKFYKQKITLNECIKEVKYLIEKNNVDLFQLLNLVHKKLINEKIDNVDKYNIISDLANIEEYLTVQVDELKINFLVSIFNKKIK